MALVEEGSLETKKGAPADGCGGDHRDTEHDQRAVRLPLQPPTDDTGWQPTALGRPGPAVFPERWETVGPSFERVIAGDGAASVGEHYFPLERSNEMSDVRFGSFYTPIPGPDGSVGGR